MREVYVQCSMLSLPGRLPLRGGAGRDDSAVCLLSRLLQWTLRPAPSQHLTSHRRVGRELCGGGSDVSRSDGPERQNKLELKQFSVSSDL